MYSQRGRILQVDLIVANIITFNATSQASLLNASVTGATGFYVAGFFGLVSADSVSDTLLSGDLTGMRNAIVGAQWLFENRLPIEGKMCEGAPMSR